MLSFIITNDKTINVCVQGRKSLQNLSIPPAHVNYAQIIEALKKRDERKVLKLAEAASSIKKYIGRQTQVKNGKVYHKGKEVHNVLTDKIIEMMRNDLPYKPMIKFFENCRANSDKKSVEELYDFLEKLGITITDRGTFLAWKSVRQDYLDWHSGTFKNNPGRIVRMPRKQVDGDRNIGCSTGLHLGTKGYAETFQALENSRIIICEVNPMHVVSVPHDHGYEKLRACQYKVIGEVPREKLPEARLDDFRDAEIEDDESEDEDDDGI